MTGIRQAEARDAGKHTLHRMASHSEESPGPRIAVVPRLRGPGLSGILLCLVFYPQISIHSGVAVLVLVPRYESFFI